MQISELSFPACNTVYPELLPESSGHDDQGLVTSASNMTGNHAALHRDPSVFSDGDSPGEAPSALLPGPPPGQPEVAQLPGPKRAALPERSPVADRKQPVLPGRVARSSQSPKKPFNSIIEHLSVVFPCYNSTELAGFIKKVRSKNKNSLSGLSIDEIVQRVTEHILDGQKKKKPNPGKDKRTYEPSSAVPVARSSQGPPSAVVAPSSKTKGQKAEDVPVRAAPGASSCEICHEVFKSKNVCVLKCGHKYHKGCFKQWLKGQSTCPACQGGDLLSEE